MGSSTNYRERYQTDHPQTDGTPDGADLAETEDEEGGGPPEEEVLTFRLATVNSPIWKRTNVGDAVTVSARSVQVTSGMLGELRPGDAQKARTRGLSSGRVVGLPEIPEPGAIIVLTP